MSSTNFSGFLSNFSWTSTPNTDIIKNISPQIGPLTASGLIMDDIFV